MRIGIDFDNTLINYNLIFNSIANELDIPVKENSKKLVKEHLINIQGDDSKWRETQALIYGKLISEANFSPEFINFYKHCVEQNIELFIISYKTKYACYEGIKVDLHKAASSWLDKKLSFFNRENVFFETAVTRKISRIASLELDIFIDDLISVLNHRNFPTGIRKILFNSDENISSRMKKKVSVVSSWSDVIEIIKEDITTKL